MYTDTRKLVISKSDRVKEIIKCGKDPVYFINKYVKIQHPTLGTLDFETYPFQDECIHDFQEHRLNIVLKSRQLGLSTVSAAYAVWMAIFYKDKNILVIATKLPTAMNFIKKVRFAIENLPDWLLLPKYEPTKQQISFSNGSQITAIPTSDDAGRSEALSLLIIDEAAFIRDFDTIWTGLAPTFSTGGSAIILSTPNGVGGQYYRLWTEAEAGQNDFHPIRIPWDKHPDHDQAWFDKETRSLPRRKIAQEYLCVGGDTKIVTPDGYKHAQDLSVGDLVLTHKGRFRPVTHVGSRTVEPEESLFEVSSPGNRADTFVLTGNHPMLSYRFWTNQASSFEYLRSNPVEPTWIAASEVASTRKTSDRIVNVLVPRFNHDTAERHTRVIDLATLYPSVEISDNACRYTKQWGNTKRFVDVNFDLGKFIGLYLAEGCNHHGCINLKFHVDEITTHAHWCVEYLQALNCRVTLSKSVNHNSCRLRTFNRHIGALVSYFVKNAVTSNGHQAPNKVLDMERVLACGPEFIKGLLYGHHAGNGDHVHGKKTCAYSTSSRLVYQLRTLNTMFGLYPRIGCNEFSKLNVNHSDTWYLELQAEGTTYRDLLEKGQQYRTGSRSMMLNGSFVGHHQLTDVSSLINNDGGYRVYDISVEEDQSFVAHSAVLHNCDFISSGDTFLQPNDLEDLRAQIMDPVEKAGHDRNVWIWSPPMAGHAYVISADVSRGDAHDYSAFHIIDVDDCEVAAEYMGKVPPEKLADMLNEWGRKYNDALIVPENNTFGYFVNVKLRDQLGYKRLYYANNKGDPFNYIPVDTNELPGFPTNQKTRVQILTKLEELIRNKQLKSYSRRLHDQLQSFVWNGNKPMAGKDSYDDLIMSLAIGCWLVEGGEGISEQAKQMAYAMLEATRLHRKDTGSMPGGLHEAQPLVNPNIRGMNAQCIYRPRDPSQVQRQNPMLHDVSDFSWLMK